VYLRAARTVVDLRLSSLVSEEEVARELTSITCTVCPRQCQLEEGQTGYCNVRKNVRGENVDALYGLFYPNPEEHNKFAPGSYTIVFPGCNLKCWYCDVPFISCGFNGDVNSWPGGAYRKLAPHEVVERVKRSAGPKRAGFNCGLMGLFGGEPTIHYEYLLEVGRLCHEAGCASKLHTSGFVSEEVLRRIAGAVNVISLNVKGSCSPRVYQRMGADPETVLRSIEVAWQTPRVDGRIRHLLIRNLIGPGVEPSEEETAAFGRWLVEKTDPFINVVVEPILKPMDHFADSLFQKDEFMPGDDADQAARRLWPVIETLFNCGLKDVWYMRI
jgi:pyruvate formate lyase activating enzyme